jgi:hypothetical protein
MNPVRYAVGQRVEITKDNWQTIRNNSRSIHAYPDDNYVNIVYGLMKNNTVGTVTRNFLPGYEFNVTFDNGQVLQMKDHWVTPLPDYDAVDLMK